MMNRDRELLSKQMGLGPVWRLRNTKAAPSTESDPVVSSFVVAEGAERAEFLFIGDGFDQLRNGDDEVTHDKKQQLIAQIRRQLEYASGKTTHLVQLRKFHHVIGANEPASLLSEENRACLVHLRSQLALIQPKVIVVLGATTALDLFALTGEASRVPSLPETLAFDGIPTLVSDSIDELLTQPLKKRQIWQTLCQVMCLA